MSARRLLIAGAALSGFSLLLIAVAPADALRAWLTAAFLWSGVSIGSLGLMMMVHLTGGRWGYSLPAMLEAGALTLPVAALAMLPVLIGMGRLYPWVEAPAQGFRGMWLHPFPFALRTLLLFAGLGLALWALVARRGSATAISSAGLIFLAPMMSIVSVDWLISLDGEFHSSGFGLHAMTVQFTVALMTTIWFLLGRQPERTATLGALLVTVVLTWIYLAFVSYFIVWSGNLAAVVPWYLERGQSGWGAVIAIAALIEGATFLALLSRTVRHSARALRAIAAAMLAGKVLECAWLVLPEGGPLRVGPFALYLLAVAGLGLVFTQTQRLLLDRRVAERAPA